MLSQGFLGTSKLLLPEVVGQYRQPFPALFLLGGKDAAEQRLKSELLIPITREDKPTACMSFNYHLDHFGEPWNIRQADGQVAVSACVGFGLERLALALFRHHGLDPAGWPARTRAALRLDA